MSPVDTFLNTALAQQARPTDDGVPRFTALEIGAARTHLTNAAEASTQIECLQIYAPEVTIRFKTKMLLSALRAAATALGYRLEPIGGPTLETPDNVTTMSR